MKKKIHALVLMTFIMCMLVACKEKKNYDTEYAYVLTYLHDNYGGNYTIKKCNFQMYDYGITAGQYIYTFEIRDDNGVKYNASYMRKDDLSTDTVSYITFKSVDSVE